MAAEKTLTIETLGRHGEGIAETDSGPVYVPFALPGEGVRAAVDGKRGRLVEVLEASPGRIEPHCTHFARCGGCAVQHWREESYRGWKRGLVETALRHRKIDASVGELINAHGEGRRRAVLHVRCTKGRVLAGFMAGRSHRVVDLDACPVLAPSLAGAPAIAREFGSALAGRAKTLDVQITATDTGLDCDIRGRLPDAPETQLALSETAARLGLARVTIDGALGIELRAPLVAAGKTRISLPPRAFLQATAAGEEALARLVLEGAGDAQRVADLFCGVGPFALRLAERASVFAADSDNAALKALDRAARAADGLHPVTVETRDLFRNPLTAKELARFDAVIFDPPRAGAEAQARELAHSKVACVIAVSCDPASFARDAAILAGGGYRIESVTPIDQFRHAAHVEIVGVFRQG